MLSAGRDSSVRDSAPHAAGKLILKAPVGVASCYYRGMPRLKKPKIITRRPWWMLNEKTAPPVVALGAMIVVIILTLVFHLLTKPAAAPTMNRNVNASATSALTIVTDDDVVLVGDLIYPRGTGPFPAVILVHEFGQDRHQWDAYRDTFVADGFAVLTYDTRGFGESALDRVPGAQTSFFGSMPNDLTAVVAYARRQTKIDAAQINVVGASLGANIAYVAAGSDLGTAKTVLLSPGVNAQLDGSTVINFRPINIFGLTSAAEQTTLDGLMASVSEPKKTTIVNEGTGRGVALLQNTEVFQSIRQWLMQ